MTVQTCLIQNSEPLVVDIDKKTSDLYVKHFHYLKERGSVASVIHGLIIDGSIMGICEWKPPCGPNLIVGAFGLDKEKDQFGFYELGRFVLSENTHNRASMFLGKSIKKLRHNKNPRAIFTFADSRFHTGIIYQATNWKYYGLTAKKTDFFVDGKKNPWGKVGKGAVWKSRPRKYRYAMIFDKSLKMRWKEKPYPKLLACNKELLANKAEK